jgi:hypothetical protein
MADEDTLGSTSNKIFIHADLPNVQDGVNGVVDY